MQRYWLFIFAVFAFSVSAQAQHYLHKLDSLNNNVLTATGAGLIKTLDQIRQYSIKVDSQEGFDRLTKCRLLAQKSKEPFAIFLAVHNLARLHAFHQQQTKALEYVQESLSHAREKSDTFTVALSHFYTAEFFYQQQLLPTALENLLEAITLFEQLKDHRYVARCRALAASIHYSVRNFIQAIDECEQVLVQYRLIPARERTGVDEFQIMSTHNTLGLCYYKTGEYDKSLASYGQAENAAKQLKNEFWIGLVNGNRAIVCLQLNMLDKALESLQLDYTISKKYGEFESASRAFITVAEIHLLKQDVITAEYFLDSARQFITDKNRQQLVEFWKVEAQIRKAKGDFAGAFDAQFKYSNLRDSVNRENESFNLTKIKAGYELERKQQEIERLALNNQESNAQIRFQNVVIASSVAVFAMLLVLIFVYVYNIRKLKKVNMLIKRQHDEIEYTNEELEAQSLQLKEANMLTQSLNNQLAQKVQERTGELEIALSELDTFLYRSSHDMRRPLSTLLGLENVAKLETRDAAVLKLFEMVADTARQMDSMLLKLQMAYELEQDGSEWQDVPFSDLLNDQVIKFNAKIVEGIITSDTTPFAPINLYSNPKWLTIIFKNILENAINFRKSKLNGELRVHVHVFNNDEHVQVVIADNGMGIDAPYLSKIFDQYFKGTEISRGNGLGLFLVKKAVGKLKGKIEVKSELGTGTTFILVFPRL